MNVMMPPYRSDITDIFDVFPMPNRVGRLYPYGVILTVWRDGCGYPFKERIYYTRRGRQDLEYAPLGIPEITRAEFDCQWQEYVDVARSRARVGY